MIDYKLLFKLSESDYYNKVAHNLSQLECKVLQSIANKFFKTLIRESQNLKQNLLIQNDTLYLFGTANKSILEQYPDGELFVVRIRSKDNYHNPYFFYHESLDFFFNYQRKQKLSRLDWSLKACNYKIMTKSSPNFDTWDSYEIFRFINCALNNLDSTLIENFFEDINNFAEQHLKKQKNNEIKKLNKRAIEFSIGIQRIIAEEVLCRYLMKDKKTTLRWIYSTRKELPSRFKLEDSIICFFKFHFDTQQDEFYPVGLLEDAVMDLDRTGLRLANAAKNLLGEEGFAHFKLVENPEFRRFYFLHSEKSQLSLGAIDPNEKVRSGCIQKLKYLE